MINNENYLQWLSQESGTTLWHDSAAPEEIDISLANGALGITTNPVLTYQTLNNDWDYWQDKISAVDLSGMHPEVKAERLMQTVVADAAGKLEPVYEQSNGKHGYVCAQVNPQLSGNREKMYRMLKRFHTWAPNIAVKLPATAAGIDVLKQAVAEGVTCTMTVSFSVAQCLAIAEGYRKGIAAANRDGIVPGKCFCVILPGRISDLFTYIVPDNESALTQEDIHMAGVAVSKRVWSIFKERGYEAALLIAAFRTNYQVSELTGGNFILSIHPKVQKTLMKNSPERLTNIDKKIPAATINKLEKISEFAKLYEPEGMKPNDFISNGIMQSILTNFYISGWAMLEKFEPGGRE